MRSLGLPFYALNIPPLVEAEDHSLQHLAVERVVCHKVQLSRTPFAAVLLKRLFARSHFRMGRLARKFLSDNGSPSALFPPLPPHQSKSILKICDSLPDLHKKVDTPDFVLGHLVSQRLANFEGRLQVFTGG